MAVLSHELAHAAYPALLTAVAMEEDESLAGVVREDARRSGATSRSRQG